MDIHVFRSEGKHGSYGFTRLATGENLPPEHGPWSHFKVLDLPDVAGDKRVGFDVGTVLHRMDIDGYFVTELADPGPDFGEAA